MTTPASANRPVRLSELSGRQPLEFRLEPDAPARAALAGELGIPAIRKLRFEGRLEPQGRRDWALKAQLGATVVQPCVVTLEPVTTRIDEPVARLYTAEFTEPESEEAEMPEDEGVEPLPEVLDLAAVMAEALALALPLYPRAPDAALGEAQFAAPGVVPLSAEAVRPFSGLEELRERLGGGDGEEPGKDGDDDA